MPLPRPAHPVPAWSRQAAALFLPASRSAQMPTHSCRPPSTPPFRPGPLAVPRAGVGAPQQATPGPPATYRSATGLIALRRCARDQTPGPAQGSRSEEKGESKCDSERHGDQNSPPRPTAPRPPGPPGADPSTHAAWGRGLAAKGRGHARPAAQLIGGKLESVSVELPTPAASGRPRWIKWTAERGQGCEVAATCCRVLRACPHYPSLLKAARL